MIWGILRGNGCDSSWCLSEKKLEARRHAWASHSQLENISVLQGSDLSPTSSRFIFEARSWRRRGRRELRRHQSNALCWQLEEADSNECLHNCSLSCSTPAENMCFRSWLINKHFSRYGCLPPGDLLLHLFSLLLSPAKKNSSPYDYVKLCLWKHTSAPLSHSPSPERAWLNCAFRRGGWRTALIGARCVPTSRRGNVFGQSSSSRS